MYTSVDFYVTISTDQIGLPSDMSTKLALFNMACLGDLLLVTLDSSQDHSLQHVPLTLTSLAFLQNLSDGGMCS